MTNSVPDLEEAECILVTGSNTTEAHPIIGARLFRAQRKGARLIVADPRRTQLARCADLHLRQRPGTDIVWLNGVMRLILDEGLEDKAFICGRTAGFDEFRETLAEYSPARVEEVTGIPEGKLAQAARWFGGAERSAILYCLGMTQHVNAVDHVWALANLALLTGNLGRPGTGVNPLRGQNNVQGACDMGALPNVFPGYQPVHEEEVREKFTRAWGLEPRSEHRDSLPSEPGLTEMEMILGAESGRVRALYIMGENPVMAEPDAEGVERALKGLEFLVVQDIFLTETAALADVVLPAAAWAEKDGTFTATDRRVQRVRKAVEPPGGARADWEIVCDLGRRMAPDLRWDYEHPSDIMDEIAALTPSYGGVSYPRLEKCGSLQWPCRSAEDPGTPFLYEDGFPLGRARFHAVQYRDADEVPDQAFPFLLTTGRIMFQYHTGTMTRRAPKLEREAGACFVEIHPEDARRLGLEPGGKLRVTSRRGTIEAEGRLTDRVEPGVLFIPFHYAEARANLLTNPALDPAVKIPEYKICAVRAEAR